MATSAGVFEYAISSSEIARSTLWSQLFEVLFCWNDVRLGIVKLYLCHLQLKLSYETEALTHRYDYVE